MDAGTIIGLAVVVVTIVISVAIALTVDRWARWRVAKSFQALGPLLDPGTAGAGPGPDLKGNFRGRQVHAFRRVEAIGFTARGGGNGKTIFDLACSTQVQFTAFTLPTMPVLAELLHVGSPQIPSGDPALDRTMGFASPDPGQFRAWIAQPGNKQALVSLMSMMPAIRRQRFRVRVEGMLELNIPEFLFRNMQSKAVQSLLEAADSLAARLEASSGWNHASLPPPNPGAKEPPPGRTPFGALGPPALKVESSILTAPMKIHKEGGRIILSQKTRFWFRAAACFWAATVLITLLMVYSELFTSQTTRFTCDRGTGVCTVNGYTNDVPRLADLVRAEMDRDFNRRDGTNWGINLVSRDGKKHPIHQQRAIKDSVVADYRATVKAINTYLADPAQQKFDTSFTYRASLGEKIKSIFYLLFGVVTLFVAFGLWTTRRYIFEPGKITVVVRGPFQHTTQEISAGRIAAISHRNHFGRQFVELRLEDGTSSIRVLEAGRTDTLMTDPLARELAQLLGKPLESASS